MTAVVQDRKETKAEVTNRIAREIMGAEVERRAAKTERLRQARLAMEARAPKDMVQKLVERRSKAN